MSMRTVYGIPVSSGIAIDEAFVQETEGFRIPKQFVDSKTLESEIRRFHGAVSLARDEIIVNRDSTRLALGQTFADIFEAQLQILLDAKLLGDIETLIREKYFSAEHAVTVIMGKHMSVLRQLKSSYIAEKVNDIRDIEKRLLRHLLGARKEALGELTAPVILLATNLTPSETANLDKRFIKAIVTEEGGSGGHTAILAAALGIPCIVGTGRFVEGVDGGDMLIVDGDSGTVIIRPDAVTQEKYHRLARFSSDQIQSLSAYQTRDAVTKDGTRISVNANIEFPYEVDNVLKQGADGVGLFRTEFLYLTQTEDPTEEEHFRAYTHVVRAMENRPVVIRTFDFGDDKANSRHGGGSEHNPALGQRGVRMALNHWELFRCQLRAILRASVDGDVRVMFPLVSTVKEFQQARARLNDCMEELREENIPFKNDIQVGMMVEVPSAVVMLDHFAEYADFFSIGTNDLIQYTIAVDRGNRFVNSLFCAEDPAVLRLIRRTIAVSSRKSIPLSLCGQMGGNPLSLVLLLGLGLRSVSCAPSGISRVKQICHHVTLDDCQAIARKAIRFSNATDVRDYVKNQLRTIAPDLFTLPE